MSDAQDMREYVAKLEGAIRAAEKELSEYATGKTSLYKVASTISRKLTMVLHERPTWL